MIEGFFTTYFKKLNSDKVKNQEKFIFLPQEALYLRSYLLSEDYEFIDLFK